MPWLDKCLESIDFSKYKVVVVDNSSSDGTVTHLHKNYPAVKLFKENQNLGFGQANNKGISYALNQGADHVFLLNQDAYLVVDALEQLVGFQKQNPEFGILSALHTNAEETRLDRKFSKYVRFDANPAFYSDHVLGRQLQDVYEVPFVNAAGWLLSKTCLMTVGGFDPIFFHYGEDDNYCQRVLYHCFKIGILPNTFMVHDREHRVGSIIEFNSKKYFKVIEKDLIIKFANINTFTKSGMVEYKKKISKQLFKACLKFEKKSIVNLNKRLNLIKFLMPLIKNSVTQNKKSQSNYLDVDLKN
jgi:GT2 family glycosyltransferase